MIARFLIALLSVSATCQVVSAGILLRFETSPGAGSSANFGLGTTNSVNLYLVATGSDIGTVSSVGLDSASLGDPAVDPIEPGVTLSGIGSIQSSNPSSAFDVRSGAVNATNTVAAWTASEGTSGDGVFGFDVGSEYYVFLGSFSVTAGNTFGDDGTLSITTPADGDFALFDGTHITFDSIGTFNFTAVPEPSAFLLMGIAVTGGAAFMRRRKTSAQPSPTKE